MSTAVGAGSLWVIIYGGYALAFWYGVKLILEDSSGYDPSSMVIVSWVTSLHVVNAICRKCINLWTSFLGLLQCHDGIHKYWTECAVRRSFFTGQSCSGHSFRDHWQGEVQTLTKANPLLSTNRRCFLFMTILFFPLWRYPLSIAVLGKAKNRIHSLATLNLKTSISGILVDPMFR